MKNRALEFLELAEENFCQNYIFKKDDNESYYDTEKNPSNLPSVAPMSIVVDNAIRIPITFAFDVNIGEKRPNSVLVCGSFDNWQVRRPLSFDPVKSQWTVTLKIKRGKYYYKYIKDGEWVVNPKEQIEVNDGIENNFVFL